MLLPRGRWLSALLTAAQLHKVWAVFDNAEIQLFDYPDLGSVEGYPFYYIVFSTVLFVILWGLGYFPADINLGRRRRHSTSSDPAMATSTVLLDCPLQFVCEVDAWANKDHQGLAESLVAYWFRNPRKSWHREGAAVFGGAGTCREMYPCPFDVQQVVGISIPGSQSLVPPQQDNYSFF